MPSLPVHNPQNRFDSSYTEYEVEDDDVPRATLHVYEDRSRSILSSNDSPDVGFTYSVNPYRGCYHACAYCADGDTRILMVDGTTRALRDVRVGDAVYGTTFDGKYRRYAEATVLAHWQTVKPAYRTRLSDGTAIITSGDHRLLTRRGWKYVDGRDADGRQRPRLTAGAYVLGPGAVADEPASVETPDYKRGYLCGMIRGDASMFRGDVQRRTRGGSRVSLFRLALVDVAGLLRTKAYLDEVDASTGELFEFQAATATRKQMMGIRSGRRATFERIEEIIAWPAVPTREWQRGFLAGVFDAEGGHATHAIRISNSDAVILAAIGAALDTFGFDHVLEPATATRDAANIRVRGGLRERLRFFALTRPAIKRKAAIGGEAIKSTRQVRVVSVEPLGFDMLMFDITTSTGDFIGDGVVHHNCYARPSHEYLSFGAGTDFERKIVIKREAPTLLREAFEKKAWKGDLVVFSGVTDCYQPLERSLALTRGCLEVCLEYKNPVGIITKSPVVERDAELLAELAKRAGCRVSISIPFWNEDHARAIEPFVTTPARRMRILETLAKAGVPVGISVSPIIPGLSDEDVPELLQRAKDAGATHAFYVLLRLPGAVATVFEERLRKELPLRAEKVLRRLREAHGGKLYDPTFGMRGRGDSVYATAVNALFEKTTKRLGLQGDQARLVESLGAFARPPKPGTQTGFGF